MRRPVKARTVRRMGTQRAPIPEVELKAFLVANPQWRIAAGQLERTYAFDTFKEGVRFVVEVSKVADAADHHPDVDIRYTKVTLRLFTHDVKALTALDVKLAHECDIVFASHRQLV